jgi:hypothetical protein
MIFARSPYDPPGTPLLPDPQEDDWVDGDEPEDREPDPRPDGY